MDSTGGTTRGAQRENDRVSRGRTNRLIRARVSLPLGEAPEERLRVRERKVSPKSVPLPFHFLPFYLFLSISIRFRCEIKNKIKSKWFDLWSCFDIWYNSGFEFEFDFTGGGVQVIFFFWSLSSGWSGGGRNITRTWGSKLAMKWWDKMMFPMRTVWNGVAKRFGIRKTGKCCHRLIFLTFEYVDHRRGFSSDCCLILCDLETGFYLWTLHSRPHYLDFFFFCPIILELDRWF